MCGARQCVHRAAMRLDELHAISLWNHDVFARKIFHGSRSHGSTAGVFMSKVAILGVPNDDNSSLLRGAAAAPAVIRRELYSEEACSWSETGFDLGTPDCWIDHGDVGFDAGGDPWDRIEDAVWRATDAGHPLICLGGDHAVTHPILRAIRRRHAQLTILHIDAHPDIYHAYQGNLRSHASPFARIMEEGLTDRLIQVGLRTINDHHRQQFARFDVEAFEAGRWAE